MMNNTVEGFGVWNKIGFISLSELTESAKLMNRIDTKYVTNISVLEKILNMAASRGYRALKVEGENIIPYSSMYYDTDSLKMFTDHHNRRLTRQKIRTREYISSGLTFLEIKLKSNKGRTRKKRIAIPKDCFKDFRNNLEADEYIANKSSYSADMLKPRLETIFRRITLANKDITERLTIDTSLIFINQDTGIKATLDDAVILELKQDGRAFSEMKEIFMELRVKPMRISKYCIGMTLTNPNAKSNRFKQKTHQIEKITGHKILVTK